MTRNGLFSYSWWVANSKFKIIEFNMYQKGQFISPVSGTVIVANEAGF